MTTESLIQEIRLYNRFYVDAIGLLRKGAYYGHYSLTETRVIYEIYHSSNIQASHIMTAIRIDKSYLGRILKKLEKDGLIVRKASEQDARASVISLSEKGNTEFLLIDEASNQQVGHLIQGLSDEAGHELVAHMRAIMRLINN